MGTQLIAKPTLSLAGITKEGPGPHGGRHTPIQPAADRLFGGKGN